MTDPINPDRSVTEYASKKKRRPMWFNKLTRSFVVAGGRISRD